MTVPDLFHLLVNCHIVTGAIGLVSFWVPVIGKKGGINHRRWGQVFVVLMLATGTLALGISACTLVAPLETHPLFPEQDPVLIRGIFGWMMQYLGVLTINLAWYGWECVRNRRDHAANLRWPNLVLQVAVTVAATNVLVRGLLIGQPLMVGISTIGFATATTNLWFLYKPRRGPVDWIKEHLKGLVGCGISVYTAFFAFGAVRLVPELALNPVLWAVPLVTGVSIILYHWQKLAPKRRVPEPAG